MSPVRSLAVLGPTATGKSALALTLAERLGGEIINCDSTAVYRGFDIGTDKVPLAEQRGIPHHLIDIVDPTREYTAADYGRDAARVDPRHPAARPDADPRRRHRLLLSRADARAVSRTRQARRSARSAGRALPARRGVEFLWRMVRRVDPPSAERILPRDRKRLVRALEVFFATGRPLTAHFADTVSPLAAGVDGDGAGAADGRGAARRPARRTRRRAVRRRPARRGARRCWRPACRASARPFGGLVYRQVMDYMRGDRDLAATRELIVRENRRYARRQLIWFRKEPNLRWFDGPGESPDVQASVLGWLAERGFVIDRGLAAHG